MKTKQEFLKNCSNPELFKKVLNAGGVNWSDLQQYPYDYYDAASGAVPGMIYYSDTEKFAKKNIELILSQYTEFCDEAGFIKIDSNNPLNWLAWFAWKNMMGELINYLESEQG